MLELVAPSHLSLRWLRKESLGLAAEIFVTAAASVLAILRADAADEWALIESEKSILMVHLLCCVALPLQSPEYHAPFFCVVSMKRFVKA